MAGIFDSVRSLIDKLDRDKKRSGFQFLSPKTRKFTNAAAKATGVPDVVKGFTQAVGQFKTNPAAARRAQEFANRSLKLQQDARKAQDQGRSKLARSFMDAGDLQRNKGLGLQRSLQTHRKQTAKESFGGGVKTLLGAGGLGAGRTAALGSTALSTGISAGFAKLTGGDVTEAAGRGFGSGIQFAGLNKLTSPIIDPIVNVAGAGKGPVAKLVARALSHGGLNVGEDTFFTALTEGRMPSVDENLTSFLIGAATSPLIKFKPEDSFLKITDDNKLTFDGKRFRNAYGQYAKSIGEPVGKVEKKLRKGVEELNEWRNQKVKVRGMDGVERMVKRKDLGFARLPGEEPKVGGVEKLEKFISDKYGRNLDKATKTQIKDAITYSEDIKFIPYESSINKKILSSPKGYSHGDFASRPALLYGGKSRGVFTDGFILIEDKSLANKINLKNLEVEKKALIKNYQKTSDITFKDAEKKAVAEIKSRLAEYSKADVYPKIETILPKTKGVEYKPQAFIKAEHNQGLVLSDGKNQAVIDPDKFAFFKKEYPNLKLYVTEKLKPVQVYNRNKRVGLIMPVRTEAPIELKPSDIFNKAKPKITPKVTKPTIEPKYVGTSQPKVAKLKAQTPTKAKLVSDPLQKTTLKGVEGQVPTLKASIDEGIAPSASLTGKIQDSSDPIISKKGKFAFNINKARLGLSTKEKANLDVQVDRIKPELEKIKGKKMSSKEVRSAAAQSEILSKVVSRDDTLNANAQLLKARQRMVELDKELTAGVNPKQAEAKTKELVDLIKVISSNAADRGRKLQSLSITADDQSVRQAVLKELSKVETDTDKIVKESLKVDWNDANSITKFYRKYIKASLGDVIDEYRYNNMLSNPRTHMRNAFTNMFNTLVTKPATIAATGDIKGAAQYYVGATKSFPEAIKAFSDSFKGKNPLEKPDLKRIGTDKLPKFLTVPTRAMEAGDKFFSKMIESGELARGVDAKAAKESAEYSLFRQGLFKEGQGPVLNKIDELTSWTYKAPKSVRWFVPFIRTPMNVAKQWIEFSPAGAATAIKSGNPREQLAKTFLGSVAMGVGAKLAAEGNTTWAPPTDAKERELFYASGRKPYSVKVGDSWVSMQYFGPFAWAVGMPAAHRYYDKESNKALTDSDLDKLTKTAMSSMKLLTGQTFMQGLQNFVETFSGAQGTRGAGLEKSLGFSAGQVVPLVGLQRYINTALDPVYRQSKTFGEEFRKNIVGAKSGLPAYTDPSGEESVREPRNLLTPFDIVKSKEEFESPLETRQTTRKLSAVKTAVDEGQEVNISPKQKSYFDAEKIVSAVNAASKEEKAAVLQGFDLSPEVSDAVRQINQLSTQGISKIDRELAFFEGEQRARKIIERIGRLKNSDTKNKKLQELARAGILTPEIAEMIKKINQSR